MNEANRSINSTSTDISTMFPYMEMGGAFLIGLSVGYALKKSFKILLFVLGLGLLFVFLLESQGAVEVNEANLTHMIDVAGKGFMSIVGLVQQRLENYKAMGLMSAGAGFLLGLKLG